MLDDLPLPSMPAFGKKLLSRLKGSAEAGLVAIGLASATMLLGIVGYSLQVFDGSFHSLAVIAFKSFGNFTPSIKNLEGGNALTDAAAVCGLLTLYSSVAVLAAGLLNETKLKAAARLVYSGHAVVVGDTPFARRAASLWSTGPRRALQIISPALAKNGDLRSRRVHHVLDVRLNRAFALESAGRVLFDLDDDVQTATLVHRLASEIAAAPTRRGVPGDREWTLVVRDGVLADHLASLLDDMRRTSGAALPVVRFVDPERLMARYLLAKHPPFLEAERRGVSRIHVLIVDFGPLGRHLLEQLFLTSAVAGQRPPKATILCAQSDQERRHFFRGRPMLADEIDVVFLEPEALSEIFETRDDAGAALLKSDQADPVTAIFLTGGKPEQELQTALMLRLLARRTGQLACPVFIREDDTTTMEALIFGNEATGDELGFVPFSLPEEFLRIELEESGERDALARAFHSLYAASVAREVPGWTELRETMRRANKNAADHCLAKLHSLGFDVADVTPAMMPCLADDDVRALLGDEPADLSDVMRLEHERWRLERLFDGWTCGEFRDDDRQQNPLIVPWPQLVQDHPGEVDKNRRQIEALLDLLRRSRRPSSLLLKRRSSRAERDARAVEDASQAGPAVASADQRPVLHDG